MVFWLGFLAGLFANWMFGMITRLLPATYVRFRVQIEKDIDKEEELGFQNRWVLVRIEPPQLKRALMEPLREYLRVQLKLDKEEWVYGKWVEGDINTYQLRTDGAMTALALVFSCSNQGVYLCDNLSNPIEEGKHVLYVRVIRTLDKNIAAEKEIHFAVNSSRLIL